MKKIIVALLAVSTLGAIAFPSHADTGNSQTSTNVSTIDGNGNSVRQTNYQSIDSGRGRGRSRGDEANIQDALNDSDIHGNRNHVDQNNDQRVRTRR
jgi:hypothetical protein